MHLPASALVLSSVLCVASVHPQALADNFPSKPVKIISQAPAGSPPDVLGRIIADRLGQLWKQQVLFVNRWGAGGLLAAQAAVTAEADGHTLYQATTSSLLVLPVTQKMAFDLNRDMRPIGLMAEQPYFITVTPSLGVSTLPEFISLARRRPGEIMYGASRGGGPYLAAEFFRSKAGIDLAFVPHPNVPLALQDLIAGRIHMMIEGMAVLSSAIRSGSIRVLAVTSPQQFASFPDVPTVSESIPGFSVTSWFALMAPVKTPDVVVRKISHDLRTALVEPSLQEKLQILGAFGRHMSPEQSAEFIHTQQGIWWPIVKQTLETP
jgi:tripartite-type tricarboxylate transporter receptor subunit TctC